MDFKSLNMNLNQKEIEKDFLFRTGQRTESSVRPSSHWCARPAPARS
jgi:hypothetical protein